MAGGGGERRDWRCTPSSRAPGRGTRTTAGWAQPAPRLSSWPRSALAAAATGAAGGRCASGTPRGARPHSPPPSPRRPQAGRCAAASPWGVPWTRRRSRVCVPRRAQQGCAAGLAPSWQRRRKGRRVRRYRRTPRPVIPSLRLCGAAEAAYAPRCRGPACPPKAAPATQGLSTRASGREALVTCVGVLRVAVCGDGGPQSACHRGQTEPNSALPPRAHPPPSGQSCAAT